MRLPRVRDGAIPGLCARREMNSPCLLYGYDTAVFAFSVFRCVRVKVPIHGILAALSNHVVSLRAPVNHIRNDLIPSTDIQFDRVSGIDLVVKVGEDSLIRHGALKSSVPHASPPRSWPPSFCVIRFHDELLKEAKVLHVRSRHHKASPDGSHAFPRFGTRHIAGDKGVDAIGQSLML